jgi:hypothetical protein
VNRSSRRGVRERHLDTATVLDYLEGRLAGAARARVEEHLGSPCGACRERLRAVEWLVGTMREDRAPEVPEALSQVARHAYRPPLEAERPPSLLEQAVRLVFDSLSAPLPALARRAVGEARRLRFAIGDHALELEFEQEEAGLHTLRGRLHAPECALHEIVLESGSERRTAWPGDAGDFAFERVPAGAVTIEVTGPAGRYRIPAIELGP